MILRKGVAKWRFNGQANSVYFDRCQMVKDNYMAYTYDTEGNLIKTVENGDRSTVLSYDSAGNMTGFTNTEGKNYTYTYNDAHQVTQAKTPRGVKLQTTYNSDGTATATELVNTRDDMKIRTDRALTAAASGIKAGAYVQTEYDQHGNATQYNYDLQSGQLQSVQTADGTTTSYSYVENTNLLASAASGGVSSGYTYDSTHTSPAADLPVQPLNHVVGADPGPVLIGKITVSQRFFNTVLHFFGSLLQLHFLQLGHHSFGLFTSGLLAFLSVDRLEHLSH